MGKRSTVTTSARDLPDFGRVVAEDYARVYRAIRRLTRDATEAEDMTQEAFLKAYRGWSGFRGEASPTTWLLRIAQNLVRDRYRRDARGMGGRTVPLTDRMADSAMEGGAAPGQAAEQRQSEECVHRCVRELVEPYRQVVYLHDLLGLPNPEIAGLLGTSVEAVKMRVHRGRQQFKAKCGVDRDEHNALACRPAHRDVPSIVPVEETS